MEVTRFISGELDDTKRRDMIFLGDFILFKDVPSMKRLGEHAASMAREAFGAGVAPAFAHRHYDKEAYLAIVDPLQRRFTAWSRLARSHIIRGTSNARSKTIRRVGILANSGRPGPPSGRAAAPATK